MKKKPASFDPIDYESIDAVDFWVAEEEPIADFNDEDVANLEDLIHNEGMTSSSTLDRTGEGLYDLLLLILR